MSTRRRFLQVGTALGAGALVRWQLDPSQAGLFSASHVLASVQSAQTPLPGSSIPQFVDALPTFVGKRVTSTNFTVAMQEFQQQILPASFMPLTWVWGYAVNSKTGSYPGVTVEAKRGTPTTIKYVNNLPIAKNILNSNLQKYLTVDQTLHWADPLNQMGSFEPYTDAIPTVVHLHGAEVVSDFDGGPDQWFTPNGIHGPAYRTLSGAPANAAVFQYPNTQPPTTLWFHDHALGMTRLNVYAGLAAFYLVRDQFDTGKAGNPLNLPVGDQEIELLIQDRQFDTNGQLYFPDGSGSGLNGTPPNPSVHPFWIPEFFGDVILVNGKSWPFLKVEPRRYRFRILNGSNARFYELRLMNLTNQTAGPPIWQIGTDGGLLDSPAKLSDGTTTTPRLFMAPAERADVIIDFSQFKGLTLTLVNGAKAPNPSGAPPDPQTNGKIAQFRVGSSITGGTDTTFDPSKQGATLRGGTNQPAVIQRLANPTVKRQLVLVEVEGSGGPLEVLLNNSHFDGLQEDTTTPIPGTTRLAGDNAMNGIWMTELPRVGSTEEWEIINTTADAHPIHVHLVQFQLLNRQAFNTPNYRKLYNSLFPGGQFMPGAGPPRDYNTLNEDGAFGGNPGVTAFLQNGTLDPDANEAGWKDTLKMFPGQVTRILLRWAPQETPIGGVAPGQNLFLPSFDPTKGPGYMWHCHILDHEDNEMMRPYLPLP